MYSKGERSPVRLMGPGLCHIYIRIQIITGGMPQNITIESAPPYNMSEKWSTHHYLINPCVRKNNNSIYSGYNPSIWLHNFTNIYSRQTFSLIILFSNCIYTASDAFILISLLSTVLHLTTPRIPMTVLAKSDVTAGIWEWSAVLVS